MTRYCWQFISVQQLLNMWQSKAGLQQLSADHEHVCVTHPGSAHRDRTVLHCQFCGKRGHAHNFMRSKRFCSTSCARGWGLISLARKQKRLLYCMTLRHGFWDAEVRLGVLPWQQQRWQDVVCGLPANTQVLKTDSGVNQSSRARKHTTCLVVSPSLSLSVLLRQVQRSSDEASAGPERGQSVGEAPPSSEQGGVSSWKTSVAATGRDTELTTSL